MRSLEDLSCLDGDMVLLESSEEHPPLILQRGMAGKLITYYKRVRISRKCSCNSDGFKS